MALVFPSNPNVNDTYTVNGRTYVWNGTTWRTIKAPVPDVLPTLSVDNDFSAGGTLHVDSVNNEIGIGTAAPSHQLHLTQDLGVDGNLIVGGTITVPTPTAGTNDTKVATTAFVQSAVAGIVDSAPATLDTLNELAAALGDDANFSTTVTNSLAGKADTGHTHSYLPLSGGTMTGTITIASGSSTNAFAGGLNYWRPQDAFGNSYFDINNGQFYVDSDVYYFRNRASTQNLTIDSSGNGVFRGRMTSSSVVTNSYSISAPRWDCSFYVLQSQHWYGQTSSQEMFLGESGNVVRVRGTINSDAVNIANRIVQYNGTTSTIVPGSDNNGAIYVGGATTGSGATGAIEASWNNSLRPQIGIGVTRDGNNTKALFTYHGWGALYANNSTRVYWDTGQVAVYGTFNNYSTRELKENIRDGHTVDGMVSADRDVAFDKWNSLRTVAFDWKEKFTDPIWRGCTEHENLFACQGADCPNGEMERVEHICGQGWCYGTQEDPCPRYRKVRNVLGWIAEEVRDIYGDHMVGYTDERELKTINMTSFGAEHVNVTQHLIRYVRELEQRIAELETV